MSYWVAGAAVVGSIGGALISSDASKSAANTQSDAASSAAAQQRADLKPWTTAGTTAIGQLSQATQPGGQYAAGKQFTMADAQNSDAEQYAQKQAMQASQNSAAARGGLIGTNEQQSLQANAAGIGSQYQNQAFNQWLQTNQQQLNALQSVAQVGQSSATNVADTTANLTLAGANAQAAGTIGSANAISGGASSLTNQLTTLGKLFGNQASTPSSGNLTVDPSGTQIDPFNNLGGAATAGDYSDRRLKKNIKRVGRTDKGLPIYTYRMKGGGPTKMGVMADEAPSGAVSHDQHGFKMVDYRRVH